MPTWTKSCPPPRCPRWALTGLLFSSGSAACQEQVPPCYTERPFAAYFLRWQLFPGLRLSSPEGPQCSSPPGGSKPACFRGTQLGGGGGSGCVCVWPETYTSWLCVHLGGMSARVCFGQALCVYVCVCLCEREQEFCVCLCACAGRLSMRVCVSVRVACGSVGVCWACSGCVCAHACRSCPGVHGAGSWGCAWLSKSRTLSAASP